MTDRTRILDKLRKLLALASSSNQHEADAARKAARALMQKHEIGEDEVREHKPSGYFELPLGSKGWNAAWRFALVTAAARFCGAEAIALQVGQRRKVRLVGERECVDRAHGLYQELCVLMSEVEKMFGAEYADELAMHTMTIKTRDISDSFRRGVVMGIAVMMERSCAPRPSERATVPGDVPGSKPRPEARPESRRDEPGLVRVRPAAQHREKIREKYAPAERPLRLDDVAVPFMFRFGIKYARDHLVVDDFGARIVKE